LQTSNNHFFSGNTFKSFFGISCLYFLDIGNSSVVISGNYFINQNRAIEVVKADALIITGNKIINCTDYGISANAVAGASANGAIEYNDFINAKIIVGDNSNPPGGATLTSTPPFDRIIVQYNRITYGVNNTGAIECVDSGATYKGLAVVHDNYIYLTGAQTNGIVINAGSNSYVGNNFGVADSGTLTLPATNTYSEFFQNYSGTGTLAFDGMKSYGIARNISLTNTGATGANTQTLQNNTFQINDEIQVNQTDATQRLFFTVSGGGTIEGLSTASTNAQFTSGTLKKIGATQWKVLNRVGTWVFS
jgi:hypothetical protein